MAELKVGIFPKGLVLKADIWQDEDDAIEYLEIPMDETSNMMLETFGPKTNLEFYGDNGSIGRYTMIFKQKGLYVFGRGDIAKLFK